MHAPVPMGAQLDVYAEPVFLRTVMAAVIAELPRRRHIIASGNAQPPAEATITRSPRLVLALAGRNRMQVPQGSSIATELLVEGDVAIIPETSWNHPLRHFPKIFLTLDCKRDSMRYYWRQHDGPPKLSGRVCQHLRLGPPPPVIQHLWHVIEALIHRDRHQAQVADLVAMLIAEMAQELDRDPVQPDPGMATWRAVCDWIDEHLDHEVTRDGLARRFTLHPNHISRLFRQQAGERFTDYLTRKRMERAAAILHDFDLTIGAVAERCGFADQAYFANVFRRHHGHSPSAWRQMRRSEPRS